MRVSKSSIVNLRYLRSMKSDIGSRINLEMMNGSKVIVTRSYAKSFKMKLGGK
ncbi:MAG: LytTR family DNA-binding domain-containing protein [Coprobacillaceae bacterium]